MEIFVLVLCIALLLCVFSIPFIVRRHARNKSVDIVHCHLPATEKQIIRCIAILTWTSNWLLDGSEQDRINIKLLRDMLEEMQKPHWTG